MPDVPQLLPPIVERDGEIWFMPVFKNKDDEPIQNSAKGPFPKPRIEPTTVHIIIGTVRKTTYTDADYKAQWNKVNSVAWRSWEPGQAWVSRILTKDTRESDQDVTIVTYIVRCCEYGWESRDYQMGYYYLDGDDKPVVFTDDNGMPYIGPLADDGTKLPAGDDMVVSEEDVKGEINFATQLGF